MTVRLGCSFAALVAAALVGRTARADEQPTERVRLVLTLPSGAEASCPRKSDLQESVIARLGYDPFATDAGRVAIVDVTAQSQKLIARVRIVAADGSTQGSREIPGSPRACADLFSSIALSLAIAIDPLSNGEPRRAPPPKVEPRAPAPAPAPPPPAPSPARDAADAPPAREVGRLGVGPIGSVGSAPSPALGFVVAAELSPLGERLHLGVEGRADLPASGDGASRPVASLFVGGLTACYGRSLLGCAVASAGVARLTSEGVTTATTAYPFFASAGARAALDLVLERVVLRPYIEAQAVSTRHTLRIDGEPRFTYPVVMGALGVVASWTFQR